MLTKHLPLTACLIYKLEFIVCGPKQETDSKEQLQFRDKTATPRHKNPLKPVEALKYAADDGKGVPSREASPEFFGKSGSEWVLQFWRMKRSSFLKSNTVNEAEPTTCRRSVRVHVSDVLVTRCREASLEVEAGGK